MAKKWWSEGVRFECQGSGKCCTSHGEYGFVFLNKEDRKRFAKYFGLTEKDFIKKYCQKTDGEYHLIERPENADCLFLKNKRCTVYDARPGQCRTWPFWPEVMSAKAWSKDVASFCPGVGKGPVISAEKIAEILNTQKSE